MAKDVKETVTIKELCGKKLELEKDINTLLLAFEAEVGLPILDIEVELQYPASKEEKVQRSIDVCVAI